MASYFQIYVAASLLSVDLTTRTSYRNVFPSTFESATGVQNVQGIRIVTKGWRTYFLRFDCGLRRLRADTFKVEASAMTLATQCINKNWKQDDSRNQMRGRKSSVISASHLKPHKLEMKRRSPVLCLQQALHACHSSTNNHFMSYRSFKGPANEDKSCAREERCKTVIELDPRDGGVGLRSGLCRLVIEFSSDLAWSQF